MDLIKLRLLGGFEVCSASGVQIVDLSARPALVLAYLALSPGTAVRRDKLIRLLWPNRAETQARASLRQALWVLRKAFVDAGVTPPLLIEGDRVALDVELIEVDVLLLEALVTSASFESLTRAVSLCRGELLEGFDVHDADVEDYLRQERERVHQLVVKAFRGLLEHQRAAERIEDAIETAQRLLRFDPALESVHRDLMHLYKNRGEFVLALKQYQKCRETLEHKLDVPPEAATEELRQEIEALRACSVAPEREHLSPQVVTSPLPGRSRLRWMVSASGVALAVFVALIWWQPWRPHLSPDSPEPADIHAEVPLTDKPSIVVLPFINMSGDPRQEYFADGITEDLTTDLSKISDLFVISRNSAFAYKGKTTTAANVAKDLGVRYILEGSVRRAGDEVRINVQLVDATTDSHLWAERYDGTIADVFALQDRVTRKTLTALAINLTPDEEARNAFLQTSNPEAYDAFLQGWSHYVQDTRNDFGKAFEFFERAIELDPDYARAHAAMAGTYVYAFDRSWQYRLRRCHPISVVEEHLRIAMRQPNALAHRFASFLRWGEGKHAEAVAEAERAVALDPNDAENYDALGNALIFSGRAAEAIQVYEKAMQLNPHHPARYLQYLGLAYFTNGQYEQAAVFNERARNRNPELDPFTLVASYGYLGRQKDAEAAIKHYWKARDLPENYEVKVDHLVSIFNYQHRADAERLAVGLIKAGICCEDNLKNALDSRRLGSRAFRGIDIPEDYQLPKDAEVMTEAEIRKRIVGNTVVSEYRGEKDSQYFLDDGTLLGVWTNVRYCDYWAASGPLLCVGITAERYCETLALEGSTLKRFELDGTQKPSRELIQGNALEQ